MHCNSEPFSALYSMFQTSYTGVTLTKKWLGLNDFYLFYIKITI